jgi:poly(3-hydroxybutyrate) depolymerase
MYHYVVSLLLFSAWLTINAQTINVKGKISNQSGKPITNAIVVLQGQHLTDTTGPDGTYTFTKSSVAIMQAKTPQSEKVFVNHGILEFQLPQPSIVKVEIFDVKGSLLKEEFSQDVTPGVYRFNLLENIHSTNLLLIHAIAGKSDLTFRYLPLRDKNVFMSFTGKPSATSGRFAKITAISDSLKITADGYKTKISKISSYDTVVNVIMDSSTASVCIGCGKSTYPKSGKATLTIDGLQRDYTLKMPENYDPNKSYMLIFCPHWLGGKMEDVISGQMCNGPYYGLEALSKGTAIFIAPQGMKEESGPFKGNTGFANTNGRDIKFFRALVNYLDTSVCIDKKRIFSTGFSFGGMMSLAVGCSMNDLFRAIAPMSGAFVSGCDSTKKGSIAMWQAHGTKDQAVNISAAKTARDYFLRVNDCGTETTPVEPSPCVAYKGCKEGYPVIYCEFDGDHGVQKWAAEAVWKFFSQF